MYRVTVGTQYGGEHYDQTFDAPDWQTALIAAAEMAKTELRAEFLTTPPAPAGREPCGCDGTPHYFGPNCRQPEREYPEPREDDFRGW